MSKIAADGENRVTISSDLDIEEYHDLEIYVMADLRSVKNGTIPKLGCGFLFAFHTYSYFNTIHERDRQPASQTLHDGRNDND